MAHPKTIVLGLVLGPALLIAVADAVQERSGPGATPRARDMTLLGADDLQARSAYQPVIQQQGTRFIAYVGHHGGRALNPLTGKVEPNGTSIVDVTDPRKPQYLHHIPGADSAGATGPGGGEAGGAQMVRVCPGPELPRGDRAKVYLLRSFGNEAHEVWDVADPTRPTLVSTPLANLTSTHKSWWECDTGIAYLVASRKDDGWKSRGVKIFDLSDPARPRYVRDYGAVGQEPGSQAQPVPPALHGPIRLGNRVYFAYGTNSSGVMQIVDREKLLKGNPASSDPFAPTTDNILYAQVGRLDMYPSGGAHTTFPVIGMEVPERSRRDPGKLSDFVVLVDESTQNECREPRQMAFMVDVTTESKPFSVASFQVPEAPDNFCSQGGRFGSHATQESFTPIYYRRLVFITYFNAGVRAVDIRDPFRPTEVAYYIPAITGKTDKRCVPGPGGDECKVAIQTNNVEVDDRGYIYIVDRANTGLHVLELTGAARAIARLPR